MAELSQEQRKRQLSALLLCGGWSIFENELLEHLACANAAIAQETFKPVEDVSKLNLAISQRNGIMTVFNIITEFKEELEAGVISPDEA